MCDMLTVMCSALLQLSLCMLVPLICSLGMLIQAVPQKSEFATVQ